MAGAHHDALVALGARWFRRQGFSVVATELRAAGSREQPDVVAFRSTCSAIIEAKVSRADFLADASKPHRSAAASGVGDYRFFLCPDGLIAIDELPPAWGLLYARAGKVTDVVRPRGNLWLSAAACARDDEWCVQWRQFLHASDLQREREMLFSIARRISLAPARP